MSALFKRLFSKPKDKLYYIEIDDEQLNKDVTTVIVTLENEIKQFKSSIDQTTFSVREQELLKLREQLTNCQQKISKIQSDVNHIMQIKEQNLSYFTIKDDSYLQGKQQHLQQIHQAIDNNLQIVGQQSSANDLKNELLEQVLQQLELIVKLTTTIVSEDVNLRMIYKKLMEV